MCLGAPNQTIHLNIVSSTQLTISLMFAPHPFPSVARFPLKNNSIREQPALMDVQWTIMPYVRPNTVPNKCLPVSPLLEHGQTKAIPQSKMFAVHKFTGSPQLQSWLNHGCRPFPLRINLYSCSPTLGLRSWSYTQVQVPGGT